MYFLITNYFRSYHKYVYMCLVIDSAIPLLVFEYNPGVHFDLLER